MFWPFSLSSPIGDVDLRTLESLWLFARLPASLKEKTLHRLSLLLAQVEVQGCAGFQVTHKARLAALMPAALMNAGRDDPLFDHVETIFIYPEPFVVDRVHEEGGIRTETHGMELSGEAGDKGVVVLNWIDLVDNDAHREGYHIALHEFAHQIDWRDYAITGTPDLPSPKACRLWKEVFEEAWLDLAAIMKSGKSTPLDPYALEHEGEFFAVACEEFFTTPGRLFDWRPGLYGLLRDYFRLDPLAWD